MTQHAVRTAVSKVFGAENRQRLLSDYFSRFKEVHPNDAWRHVYHLLLWIDRTTGLAHCYESDKSQPGRPWYARSLHFHAWVSESLEVPSIALGNKIDWLFRRTSEDLAQGVSPRQQERAKRQVRELQYSYMPEPGRDPQLEDLILDSLDSWLAQKPPPAAMRSLVERIHRHTRLENKRKNLVGEGFEDLLATLVSKLPMSEKLAAVPRSRLDDIPGFFEAPGGEKPRIVDLAILRNGGDHRVLVTAKWSIRADREEQFVSDATSYVRLERLGRPFDYVLVTNEFDPARLSRAVERQREGKPLFTDVVHVNTAGLRATYQGDRGSSWTRALQHVDNGRIVSLSDWLARLQVC